jgi:hypothetical protein
MTDRELLELAREAGFEIDCASLEWHRRIERFAHLVRAEDEALLRQALNYCEEVACSGVSLGTEMETMRARLACLLLERLGLTTSSRSA